MGLNKRFVAQWRQVLCMLAVAAIVLGAGSGGSAAAGPEEGTREQAAPLDQAEREHSPDQDALTAAFVRDGSLWIKSDKHELLAVRGQHVRNPTWSQDGKWIAFTQGENQDALWLFDTERGTGHFVAQGTIRGANLQWSPTRSLLAYQVGEQIMVVDPTHSLKPREAAPGIQVGSFSWLPDGRGFIASTASELLPGGSWKPVIIVSIPLADKQAGPVQTLYTFPVPNEELLVVDTSRFEWSADGQWVAFLAKPTASLSADSNKLAVLSADGKQLRLVDDMAGNEQWFAWSPGTAEPGQGPAKPMLAYIGGVGREATSNKQLRIVEIPDGKPVAYTPAGQVDQGFTWQDNAHIIVQRAAEAPAWPEDPAARPLPVLYRLAVGAPGEQGERLVRPSQIFGAYSPQWLHTQQLGWIRSDRKARADAIIAEANGSDPDVWIEGLDLGENYYEQWDWDAVIQYQPRFERTE